MNQNNISGNLCLHVFYRYQRKHLVKYIFYMLIILLVFTTKLFIIDIVAVKGSSMEPTLLDGNTRVVFKAAYWFAEPRVGDIVIVVHENENLIKRITACPGEIPADAIEYGALPKNLYFIEGDNRHVSIDSRNFGPVPGEDIIGRVINWFD